MGFSAASHRAHFRTGTEAVRSDAGVGVRFGADAAGARPGSTPRN
ncbi:hypothetical protein A176_005159 [Myxococcus hansupus]|uniref:Uncharacterized protein n=1 Tax=Pseudomyxococcus hansupus TaxID=1297742 RepID=A0A0H4XJ01_9BACT|nr:hypothetical protein A176_005159 [Myxococcus hansupus]